MSRASIIAEIQQDIRRMEKVIELLGGAKMMSIDDVSIDEVVKPRKARRKMSASARRRISKAQKARWSKWKAAKKG